MDQADLFRQEALRHQLARDEGRPRLLTPPGSGLICLLLLSALAVAGCVLVKGDYTRKTTVSGYIQTGRRTERVYTNTTGTIEAVLVHPGEVVSRDQVLARYSAAGGMRASDRRQMLVEYDLQRKDIVRRIDASKRIAASEKSDVEARMSGLASGITHIERVIDIQLKKVARLTATRDDARSLYRSGRLSRIEWDKFNEALLNATQALEQLRADAESKRNERMRASIELKRSKSRFDGEQASLEGELSRLEQSRRTLVARTATLVRTPISGRIANVFVEAGQSVMVNEPVASVTPQDAVPVARLLIPSSAIGFLHVGQAVNLLYDAFPYQTFGTFKGRLIRLSRQALNAGDTPGLAPHDPPFFEAIVRLDDPWVIAYGQRIRVRPGMTLQADILLDHRSLLAWAMSPLAALQGRDR